MFTPDSESSSKHPLDYLFVTRSEILVRGALGGGAGIFVILVVIGLIYVAITAVFSFLAAVAGVIALMFMSERLKLEAEENMGGVFVALGLGFLAFNGVSLILDIMFDTWLSVPGMLGLLGEPACRAPCMRGFQLDVNGRPLHMLVEDLGDFYTYTIGSEGAGLGRYLLQSIPGTLALSYVLGYSLPAVPRTVGGLLRLFAAGCVAVVAAMVVAFPLMALLMLWLRNLILNA
jgi:hypothetical protein